MKALRLAAALAALVLVTGCASVPAGSPGSTGGPGTGGQNNAQGTNPADPWEAWNRRVYAFNDAIDVAVLKPVATAYQNVVPQLVRTGVNNFFGNVSDVWSAANHLLQGKVGSGLEMGFRALTNTVMGFGGLLDPATEFGMQRRSEDFGQTLGVWGVGNGPFLMLPLLGPSTVRDTVGRVVDREGSISELASVSSAEGGALTALEIVNLRAGLLSATGLMDRVALDRYSFLRDAYLQRRLDAVYDGAAPMVDEFADEPTGTPPVTKAAEPGAARAVQPGPAAAPKPSPGAAPGPAVPASPPVKK